MIKSITEKPFVLSDFMFNTKFVIRSKSNNYKGCSVLVESYCCNEKTTELNVVVWESLESFGRHTVSIDRDACDIDIKDLLFEIANHFQTWEKDDMYVETTVYSNSEKISFQI